MKVRYQVITKDGTIIVDGEGNKNRFTAMVKACNSVVSSASHAGTVKCWLNVALGNEPQAVLLEENLTKSEALVLERKSHKTNGRPVADATKFFLQRLVQLGKEKSDLDRVTQAFFSSLLKHGDNASTSRLDYEFYRNDEIARREIEEILQIKL